MGCSAEDQKTTLKFQFVEIEPKNDYLSAEQLIAQRHVEIDPSHHGLKRTHNEASPAEIEELQVAYANLRAQLSVPRIATLAGRSLAIWHEKQQTAEVVRKDGKFENFGYSQQGKLFLEYYEALFLIELGRLHMEYHQMIVSLEQAYHLLLEVGASERYNNYLVYSILSRVGYIVVRHQRPAAAVVTQELCIWSLLDEKVGHKPVPATVKASPLYDKIQHDMTAAVQQIICQQTNELSSEPSDFKFDTRKRKAEESDFDQLKASKRPFVTSGRSLVDFLKAEPAYKKFQEIFQKFDIVKLESCDHEDSILPTLTITFDLHLPNEGFRKSSPKAPAFSVVILPANEPFPTHDQIAQCQRKLVDTMTPLLLVSVSESKQIQAFLYYIS